MRISDWSSDVCSSDLIFVIDEADRMLDMGFMPDIERIGKMLPPLRQTLFFSATMAPEMRRLADKFLSNPKEIEVARQATTAESIAQFAINVPHKLKREAMRDRKSTRLNSSH